MEKKRSDALEMAEKTNEKRETKKKIKIWKSINLRI